MPCSICKKTGHNKKNCGLDWDPTFYRMLAIAEELKALAMQAGSAPAPGPAPERERLDGDPQ